MFKKKVVKAPQIIVPRRVLLSMVKETLAHPHTETGQSLVGIENDEFILVLDTIPDVLSSARTMASFGIGGQNQVEIWRWALTHWDQVREKSRTHPDYSNWKPGQDIPKGFVPEMFDLDLAVLGDWHKHPGDMRTLSFTDLRQIQTILLDKSQDKEQLVAPIVTYNPSGKVEFELREDQVLVREIENEIWINWYYAHESRSRNTRELVDRVQPKIVPDNQAPWLAPLPWHLKDVHRMRRELALLRQEGFRVWWHVLEMGGDEDIREIVFAIDHKDWDRRLVLVTHWDYPNTLPLAKFVSKPDRSEVEETVAKRNSFLIDWVRNLITGEDIDFWKERNPVRRWAWDREVYLVDVVKKLEARGDLYEDRQAQQDDREKSS